VKRATKPRTKVEPARAAVPLPASRLHEPFLERAADPALADSGQQALGAFLTLRLIDRFAVDAGPTPPQALEYQTQATRDYLLDLHPQAAEAGHLLEIVRVADAVQCGGNRRLLWAPLQAYAYWLEQELRLSEALDVVDTGLRLNDGHAVSEETAAKLQSGRILRLLGRFDEARNVYEAARARAMSVGDMHSALLGRIGDALVLQQLGSLPACEAALREILHDAEELDDRDARARAHHDLGAVLVHREQTREAIGHLYRAFELYEQPAYRLRALSDAGDALKAEGHYAVAKDAYTLVLKGGATPQIRASTTISLLELSALTGDRLSFARWAREVSAVVDELPPEKAADFALQVGRGHATFGQSTKARAALERAQAVAEQYKLNEYAFRAQQALAELDDAAIRRGSDTHAPAPAEFSTELVEIAEKLQALRAG
jgi:tetratricopeptide (TPR) repeat protein